MVLPIQSKKEIDLKLRKLDERLTEKYNLNFPESIVVSLFIDHARVNKDKHIHQHQGRTWVRMGYTQLVEESAYNTSRSGVGRILRTLVEKNVLLKSSFNAHNFDKTSWYAFVDENYVLAGDGGLIGNHTEGHFPCQ